MTATPFSLEKAYSRLEEILESLNSSGASLDSSLKLFEEASALITKCNSALTNAETKIEMLVKSRANDTAPETTPFTPNPNAVL